MDYFLSSRTTTRHFPMASITPTIREDEEYDSSISGAVGGIMQNHHHHSEYHSENSGMNYQISDSSNSNSGPLTMATAGALVPSSSNSRNKNSTTSAVNNNPLISETEKCNVCGEAAAKHVHYGATTCFSCRAFFRRSIQNQSTKQYICRKGGNCVINLKTRKNCQKCRFDKCLDVGMKSSWVLSEEERFRRFRKHREKVAKRKNEGDEQSEYHEQTHQTIKRRISDSELENSSISSSPTPSFEPMDLSGNLGQSSSSYSHSPSHIEEIQVRTEIIPSVSMMVDTSTTSSSAAATSAFSVETAWPARVNMPSYEVKDMAVHEVAPIQMPTSGLYHLKSVSAALDENLKYHPTRITSSSNRDQVQNNWREQPEHQQHHKKALPFCPPMIPDDRQLKDENDEEVEEIIRDDTNRPQPNQSPDINQDRNILYQISQDELDTITRISYLHDRSYKSVNFGEDLIKEMLFSSVCRIPLSAKSTMTAYRLMIQRVHKVATAFDPFSKLSMRTQAALLKHNADLVVSLRGAIFFEQRKQGLDQIIVTLGINDCDFAKQIIRDASQQRINKIEYTSMNGIQKIVSGSDSENRYNKLMERVGSSISFDINLSKILTYCLLFMSEFPDDIEDRSEVQAVQETMIRMLQRYIYAKYPREIAVQIFAKILNCVVDLQELTWIKKQRAMAADTRSLVNTERQSDAEHHHQNQNNSAEEENTLLTDANKPKSINRA